MIHQDCPECFKQTGFVLPVPWCGCVLQALRATQVPAETHRVAQEQKYYLQAGDVRGT